VAVAVAVGDSRAVAVALVALTSSRAWR